MGFINKVKTGIKNVDSKAGQKVDEAKINSDIRSKKSEIEKIKSQIGEAYYAAKKDGKSAAEADQNALYEKIVALEDEIEELEAEKEKVIAEAKAEREANRKATE